MVKPKCDFGIECPKGKFLQCENADGSGLRRRHKGFVTNGFEIAGQKLHAAGSAPSAALILSQLDPAFDRFAFKDGPDIGAFQFGMVVIGIAGAQSQCVKQAGAQFHLSAQIKTILAQINRNAILLNFCGEIGTFCNPILCVIYIERHAQIAAFIDEGAANACAPCFHIAIW